jgi:hypothetical protein
MMDGHDIHSTQSDLYENTPSFALHKPKSTMEMTAKVIRAQNVVYYKKKVTSSSSKRYIVEQIKKDGW